MHCRLIGRWILAASREVAFIRRAVRELAAELLADEERTP